MTQPFRIGILDAVPRIYWHEDEGISDGEKFHDLLAAQDAGVKIDIYCVTEGRYPASIDDYDGYLISGSPASANDNLDWIAQLADWIVRADSRNKRIVASCFGHQLVARTFGGRVDRNEDGWLIGNYPLQITRQYDWMEPGMISTGLFHFNQERVVRLPAAAVSFADSDDYPDYAYTLGDNIMCMQGHPEQPLRAMNNFLAALRPRISREVHELARAMIDNGEPDSQVWGQWIMRFFLA